MFVKNSHKHTRHYRTCASVDGSLEYCTSENNFALRLYISLRSCTHTHTHVSVPPMRTLIDSTVKWRHLDSPLLCR